MNEAVFRTLRCVIGLAMLVLSACGGGGGPEGPATPPSRPTLSSVTDTTLLVDETTILSAVARDGYGQRVSNAAITWRSSAPGTVDVDGTGRIRALAVGTAVVTASWNELETSATVTASPQFVQIAPGAAHTCGITGRGHVYCWGTSVYGEIGITGENPGCSQPFDAGIECTAWPARSTGLATAVSVTAGEMHTCALDADQRAFCWGANFYGQAGTGLSTSGRAPIAVKGALRFVQLVAGRMHTCGITAERDAYCWGWDRTGQLGAGDVSAESCTFFGTDPHPCSRSPRLVVGGHKWGELAAAGDATCGLTTDGEMYCWGLYVGASDGLYCQAANNLEGCTRMPFHVASAKRIRDIRVGDGHRCQQIIGGTLECWGSNYSGTFGNGTITSSMSPTPAGGGISYTSFVSFRTGVCALLDGQARCWGRGIEGQIGDGRVQDAWSPAIVAGGHRFTALASNGSSDVICGLATTGRAYCWGYGIFGQLGNGTFLLSGVPVQVRLLREPTATTRMASPVGPR